MANQSQEWCHGTDKLAADSEGPRRAAAEAPPLRKRLFALRHVAKRHKRHARVPLGDRALLRPSNDGRVCRDQAQAAFNAVGRCAARKAGARRLRGACAAASKLAVTVCCSASESACACAAVEGRKPFERESHTARDHLPCAASCQRQPQLTSAPAVGLCLGPRARCFGLGCRDSGSCLTRTAPKLLSLPSRRIQGA